MTNWSILKTAIADVIRTNGNQEITGQVLQSALNSMINALGEYPDFAGIAIPTTVPGTFDGPVFFLASTPGNYPNFSNITLNSGELVILRYGENTWVKEILLEAASMEDVEVLIEALRLAFEEQLKEVRSSAPIADSMEQGTVDIRLQGISRDFTVVYLKDMSTFAAKVGSLYYNAWPSWGSYAPNGSYILASGRAYTIGGKLHVWNGSEMLDMSTPIINDLTTGGADKALSAEMGKELKCLVDEYDKAHQITNLYYNGGSLKESNVPTYKNVFQGLKLLAGVTIRNNGVPILVAKNDELEGRIDIWQGNEQTLPYDINLIMTINVSGDVDLDIIGINDDRFATKEELENHTFSGNAIEDKSISIEKLAFASSVNLLNLNANGVALGKYISTNGRLYNNAAYNTTDFIPVTPSKTYQLFTNKKSSVTARFVGLYNSEKELVETLLTSVVSVTVPDGVKYMRITYYVESWNERSIQVTEGNSPIDATPYSMIIEKKYLPSLQSGVDNFFVPKDIYVASGRTIELYYSQILLNYQNYNVKAECSIGASLSRKFQIKGDDAHIGDYPLTISVYNDNAELLAYATSTIHIVAASTGNTSILPIGDSLTNGKAWLSEVRTLSNNSVTFVGTRKTGSSSIKHEGRSGASCNMYNTDGTYTYADNAYGGIGEDSEIFDTTKSYKVGDLCKYDADVYIFTSAHSGIWDDSHVRNLSQKNPFWDWENNQFSINHYKSLFGIDYNAIMIFLGTNGINLTPEANANGALGIKTLIENIRREDAVSPIIVINTIYRSGQNGIGTQGNTDGYKAQSEFKFNADRKVMLLAKAVENMIGGMDNVYICPVGFTHDSEYNFGSVKKEVNPRLTDTSEVYELFPKDSVHPQASGYMQMADEMFSILCAIYENDNT